MAEEPILIGPMSKSGWYTGNGDTLDIETPDGWEQITITSEDRKYIITYFKSDNQTIGLAAVGAGDQYRKLKIIDGGVSVDIDKAGFTVGNHFAINTDGTKYFWSVM